MRQMVGAVRGGVYKEEPYLASGELRIRVRDDHGLVIYDDPIEEYVALNRDAGINIGTKKIQKLTKIAQERLHEHQ